MNNGMNTMSDSTQAVKDKKVVGLYGEMRLAMELHKRGWQVYRAYIDEKFDFVIMKCYCTNCKQYTEAHIREEMYQNKKRKCVTNLCEQCEHDSLHMIVRFIQVKTSEGKHTGIGNDADTGKESDTFSFHAKIRYHIADNRMFYVWIATWDEDHVHFYIFKPEDVDKFDNIQLPTYQITDNQKNSLRINKDGDVLNQGREVSGRTNDYSVFHGFRNNFAIFEDIIKGADFP